jgi:hypothetical protein
MAYRQGLLGELPGFSFASPVSPWVRGVNEGSESWVVFPGSHGYVMLMIDFTVALVNAKYI